MYLLLKIVRIKPSFGRPAGHDRKLFESEGHALNFVNYRNKRKQLINQGGKPGKDNLFSLIFLYDSFVHNFFLNIMFLVFQVAQGKIKMTSILVSKMFTFDIHFWH